jgi:hypothetical protein
VKRTAGNPNGGKGEMGNAVPTIWLEMKNSVKPKAEVSIYPLTASSLTLLDVSKKAMPNTAPPIGRLNEKSKVSKIIEPTGSPKGRICSADRLRN